MLQDVIPSKKIVLVKQSLSVILFQLLLVQSGFCFFEKACSNHI